MVGNLNTGLAVNNIFDMDRIIAVVDDDKRYFCLNKYAIEFKESNLNIMETE